MKKVVYGVDIFLRKELIKKESGYTLVLYLEKQDSEFAQELFGKSDHKNKKLPKASFDYIRQYVRENYPDIKINSVKIMAGTLVVASIGYAALNNPNIISNALKNQDSIQTSSENIVKPDETEHSTKPSDIEITKPIDSNNNNIVIGAPPINEELKDSYTVKKGDTLYSISKKYDVSVDELKEINNLTGENIYTGQKLKLSESLQLEEARDTLVLVNKNNALSPDYVPDSLVTPNVPNVNKSKIKMASEAAEALEALFQQAKEDNINITAISGYRSYALQDQIFASNVKKYQSVAAANQFSAKPGQSEHQTGLAMDISSPSLNYQLKQSFAQTKEGVWLKENAPKYGFILRYQKGKEDITGYQFEPWHFRYVGVDAALEISEANITLEEYLDNLGKIEV
jgi:LAS superfamily LD-carboxypeptidase LdcB